MERVLLDLGFLEAPKKGKGSYKAFYKIKEDGSKLFTILSMKDIIPLGTLKSIMT